MILRDFQDGVTRWVCQAFGLSVLQDKPERRRRFLEESLELLQALGMTREEVLRMVTYVYDREPGEPLQELGGTLTTLAALASGHGMDLQNAGPGGGRKLTIKQVNLIRNRFRARYGSEEALLKDLSNKVGDEGFQCLEDVPFGYMNILIKLCGGPWEPGTRGWKG